MATILKCLCLQQTFLIPKLFISSILQRYKYQKKDISKVEQHSNLSNEELIVCYAHLDGTISEGAGTLTRACINILDT